MSKQPEQFRMLIGGKAVDAISGRTFEPENRYLIDQLLSHDQAASPCGGAVPV